MKAEVVHHPPASVVFDSSTHQGEALAVLVRFVNEEFEIVERLCAGLQILASTIICTIRDGTGVNGLWCGQ